MEHNRKVLPAETLIPALLEALEQAEAVPLTVTGHSMTPFLQPERDTVYLTKLTFPLRRGQMVLYRRDNGRYILHRIYRITPEGLQLIGDGQVTPEPRISPAQVVAGVSAVRRNGRLLRPGHPVWFFYEKLWLWAVPLRPRIRGLMARLRPKNRK